jgi:aryl-alcohol dehydrogenase-like predicted oxidoreductase
VIARRLGPDGPALGAIGYGAMALSFPERPGESAAIDIIHALLDRGVTLLDTADMYTPDERDIGHNERLIGKAVRAWRGDRTRVVVATKGGYTRRAGQLVPDGRPEHLRLACERSLLALGVDTLDLYQLHIPDPTVPFAESVGALRDLRAAGKVRWVGLSNVTLTMLEAARAIAPIQSVQNEASVLHRDSLRTGPVARLEQRGWRGIRQARRLVGEPFSSGVAAQCARLGITFLAYSPLGGARRPSLAANPALARVARAHGASVYAVALAWLLAQSPVIVPIPSARSAAHALDAFQATTIDLSPEDLAALDGAV